MIPSTIRKIAVIGAILCSGIVQARPRTVVIDVGHSHRAPGSTSAAGRTEFDFNRRMALDLASEMRRIGWTVLVPNSDGRTTSLAQRPAAATAAGADLLLSIHHDSIQSWQMQQRESFHGFSTWTSGTHPGAATSARCADAIGSAMTRAGMRPNTSHAAPVPGEGRDLRNPATGRYRRDDLAVLRLSRTPAVLIEIGVIVNPVEEAWLSRDDVRRAMARVIAAGADACIAPPR